MSSGHHEAGHEPSLLRRLTVCKLAGHKWTRIYYPPDPDGQETGHFLRCLRCGKENHSAGTVARGPSGML